MTLAWEETARETVATVVPTAIGSPRLTGRRCWPSHEILSVCIGLVASQSDGEPSRAPCPCWRSRRGRDQGPIVPVCGKLQRGHGLARPTGPAVRLAPLGVSAPHRFWHSLHDLTATTAHTWCLVVVRASEGMSWDRESSRPGKKAGRLLAVPPRPEVDLCPVAAQRVDAAFEMTSLSGYRPTKPCKRWLHGRPTSAASNADHRGAACA